ncbi:MAG: hypothetical protein HOP29_09870 [Phycisphaerales bacterium]|nr:hypothetical protein [Phycisphaerales bacterium]
MDPCQVNEFDFIADRLRRRERLHEMQAAAMLILGVPLSLLGPFVLACIFWLAVWQLAPHWNASWLVMFAALCVIVIPLLYRQEFRVGDAYYDDVLRETEVYGGSPGALIATPGMAKGIVAAAVIAANPRAFSAGFVEVFLTGPRLVVDALRRRRVRGEVHECDFRRAVEMVRLLHSLDGGIDTEKTLHRGERIDDLIPTLAYLVFYRWIGVRGQWTRIWLTSHGRESLQS